MLSEDSQELSQALAAARAIRPSATGPALRAALIALLERPNQDARATGGRPLEDPESQASLQHIIRSLAL